MVTVELGNGSDRGGAAVVQVYRRDPELTLVGFAKAYLAPGETRTVTIAIPRRRLQTWAEGWTDIPLDALLVGRSATDIVATVALAKDDGDAPTVFGAAPAPASDRYRSATGSPGTPAGVRCQILPAAGQHVHV